MLDSTRFISVDTKTVGATLQNRAMDCDSSENRAIRYSTLALVEYKRFLTLANNEMLARVRNDTAFPRGKRGLAASAGAMPPY
jgi:hypothetical protein